MSDDSKLSPSDHCAALRIVDANLNRATEGTRVVEEYCRFALDDAHLTSRCKAIRHQLVAALSQIPQQNLLAARDTVGDVGTVGSGLLRTEPSRASALQVAIVNGERVKQAIRAIEEYAKLVAPAAASNVEALRYQWYTLEKALLTTSDSRERLAGAQLYVLIDGGPSECAFVERVRDLREAGVSLLQLRDKRLNDGALLARARLLKRTLVELASDASTDLQENRRKPALFIMNDRPDLALLARADGIHVGQEELSVGDVRRLVGPDMIVGVSTHNIAQARQAVLDGANYLGCGPVFPSPTKAFDQFPGLEFLRQVTVEISLPAFAIGGIDRGNLSDVLATGFSRIAVGNAVWGAADPAAAVKSFHAQLTSRLAN